MMLFQLVLRYVLAFWIMSEIVAFSDVPNISNYHV